MKLTAHAVQKLRPVGGERTEYFDKLLPGFSVRVAPTGRKTFCVLYRRGRRLRRYTLGRYPPLNLSQARAMAKAALAQAAMGGDPAARKIEERQAGTFAELAAEYLERHAKPNKRSWREDERRIRKNLLPALGFTLARDVIRADVRRLLEDIVRRPAPSEANQTLALIRKIYNWAIGQDLVEDSPCRGLPRPAKTRQRHHVLSEDDIRKFWNELTHESPIVAAALKLRFLTAQRGGEIVTMRWEDVELDARWWTIPTERSKNGLPHRVPLSRAAIDILRQLDRTESPWVFPSPRREGHLCSTQKAIERIRKRAAIELRGHDLRRTAASFMTSMGTPRLVVAKILNHVETGVTAVYDRHSYDREKRDALDAWSIRLLEMLRVDGIHDQSSSSSV
jgi:integrase